ncbi:MAG: glycogen synthase GlgA [candidate division KSB1 bacterium]|nr:glycogen synthase GlgA [candidate division KSB1 bacterium]
MKNKFRVLFLSSEVAPFAKTGGLADVSSSLPKALFELDHDIRVIMPKYGVISERRHILREVIRLKRIPVRMGGLEYVTSARSAFLPNSKVQIYFLDYKPFFGRHDLYVDSTSHADFPDNAERFMLFCRSVLEIIRLLHWQPQIIHCNDWQTAMIPWLLKYEFADDPFFAGIRTILTVHNMAYQGSFPREVMPKIGLDPNRQESEEAVIYDRVNFLKAGILSANLITTVSPTYAREIQEIQELGAGLGEILKARSQDLYGILNGIDETVWNPETDTFLPYKYSAATLDLKLKNKQVLLERAGLPIDEKTPVIGMVSRLVEQKGFDLVIEAFEKLMSLNCRLVVLGEGEAGYVEFFKEAMKRFPQQTAAFFDLNEELAHLIEAGSDMFLMPSRFEPCGLNQMYSMKYGTLPIVRKTGGLADTVIDFISDPERGTGFVFEPYTANALLAAVQNALFTYRDERTWRKIQKRAMKMDFSWKASAENYSKIYQQLLAQQ